MKEKLQDIKYRIEERAAIEYEDGVSEAQRASSVQFERKTIRDALTGELTLLEANRAVLELEKEVWVYVDKGGCGESN